MAMDTGDIPIKKQYVLLIYPFRHAVTGPERETLLRRLNDNWLPWWRRFDPEEQKRTWDDTYFFLPHLRELLFPETADEAWAATGRPHPSPENSPQPAYFSALSAEDYAKQISPHGVLRLTHRIEQLKPLRPSRLTLERENFSVPLQLHWADLILFPQGVGFLVLKVELMAADLMVSQLRDFLYYVRMIHPPRLGWDLARWDWTEDGFATTLTSRDLVDCLLKGITLPSKAVTGDKAVARLGDWVKRVNEASGINPRVSETDTGQVYGQSFHLYTYACRDTAAVAGPDGMRTEQFSPFSSPDEQALYELTTGTDTADPNYRPHPAQVKHLLDQGLIALWANWQGLALHDNVAFLGTEPSNFLLHGLAHNVETDYFHLYLLVFYQKMRLSFLSGELVRRDTALHDNLTKASTLWDDFMRFRNHYWFQEVTFNPQGIELYNRFQRALFALPLYETVSKEVRDLQEYYSGKAAQRATSLIFFLTVIGLPVSLGLGFFSSARFHTFAWFARDSCRHFALAESILLVAFIVIANLWVHIFANLGQRSRRDKR